MYNASGGKFPPNSSPNSKANPNPAPNRGWQFSLGKIIRTPVKTKETENRKEIKNNRRKTKYIKQRGYVPSN